MCEFSEFIIERSRPRNCTLYFTKQDNNGAMSNKTWTVKAEAKATDLEGQCLDRQGRGQGHRS